jgi:lipoprotein-anchoring transpeptidase ErfK/SrfK
MVDYYSLLRRTVTAPDAGDTQWRRGIYDRARRMLVQQLRARQPPASQAEIAAEQASLNKAIARIEAEMARSERGDITDVAQYRMRPARIAKPLRMSGASLVVLAVVAAALGAGGYVMLSKPAQKPQPAAQASAAKPTAPTAAATPQAASVVKVATAKDGDLPPGIDGGGTDPDLPYTFRRQPTFYRTLQPVGTVIVDKGQHYLYLIQPNNVALRYGIGIGDQCKDLGGLRHIASKAEWPPWQVPPNFKLKLSNLSDGTLPGGPGNPLGARLIELDDHNSRINGTNAPKTIGTTVIFGCIRLGNDDVVDLYNRVQVGTAVLVN